jgi:hypothetical protein
MNPQKAIRDYFWTAIKAATNLPDESIYRSPRFQIPVVTLPAIAIYGHSDTLIDPNGNLQERIYTVAVDITCVGRIEDDTTDELAGKVRAALIGDNLDDLSGLAMRTVWKSQEWGGREQDRPVSGTILLFDVYYWSGTEYE